jgi:predicted aspartyl protease
MRSALFFVFAFATGTSALAAKPQAAAFAADLPFRDCNGVICIDVALDGAPPHTLLLDTGNTHSTLVTEVAKPLGWTLSPYQRNGKSLDGVYETDAHRAALGSIEGAEKFLVVDRARLGDKFPPVDGSIAYDFFKDRVLQIDYARHRLRISNVLTAPVQKPSGNEGALALITFGEHGPPIVVGAGFRVNGRPLRAQIDTAYTGSLLVYDNALGALGLTKQGRPEYFPYTDGGVNMLAAPAQSIGFGTQVIATHPTMYFVGEGDNPVHQPDGLFEATVGNALFAHSVLTLDFHAMKLDVKPSNG